jgi:hypothetical protein
MLRPFTVQEKSMRCDDIAIDMRLMRHVAERDATFVVRMGLDWSRHQETSSTRHGSKRMTCDRE